MISCGFSWLLMSQQMLLFGGGFIHGVNAMSEVTEEVASMNSLLKTTTTEDIFRKVKKTLIQYKLK